MVVRVTLVKGTKGYGFECGPQPTGGYESYKLTTKRGRDLNVVVVVVVVALTVYKAFAEEVRVEFGDRTMENPPWRRRYGRSGRVQTGPGINWFRKCLRGQLSIF